MLGKILKSWFPQETLQSSAAATWTQKYGHEDDPFVFQIYRYPLDLYKVFIDLVFALHRGLGA